MNTYRATYLQNGVEFYRYFQADDLNHAEAQAADALEQGETLFMVQAAQH